MRVELSSLIVLRDALGRVTDCTAVFTGYDDKDQSVYTHTYRGTLADYADNLAAMVQAQREAGLTAMALLGPSTVEVLTAAIADLASLSAAPTTTRPLSIQAVETSTPGLNVKASMTDNVAAVVAAVASAAALKT